ncbi:hypothetical protein FR483_n448L [Paramecium bursaria Chlorella virus FR483]|uniref:Uncharacterized protein n448L n=1 Tax=Paramecium bursaria Chlorella virus FR483 TaxID=399781 RepID=A7J7F2_PBCVF|nr:hypothetical protein FR483_n448L [Paramecium bursaria Chlorella virus FR483]ABT15733.1 hypothetical protein FR483_n448L [Paramecium bursaria Chlorella virus FR483]
MVFSSSGNTKPASVSWSCTREYTRRDIEFIRDSCFSYTPCLFSREDTLSIASFWMYKLLSSASFFPIALISLSASLLPSQSAIAAPMIAQPDNRRESIRINAVNIIYDLFCRYYSGYRPRISS